MSRTVSTPNSSRHSAIGARARISLTLALCAVSGAVVGCDGDTRPVDREETQADGRQSAAAAVTPAVYQTTLAFLGFGAPPARLFLHLENRTSAEALELRYRGWLESGSGWWNVLDVRESTGVPRAAWRILPVGPLRVSVTDGEELAGVAIEATVGRPRLRIGEGLAEWASSTGQRESLRRAALDVDGSTQDGILLASQTARVAGAAMRGGEHAILLADTLGGALVILRSGGAADAQVVVHSLLGERSRRWDGAELRDASEAGDGTGAGDGEETAASALTLAIPGAGIDARIVVEPLSAAGVGTRAELPDASAMVTVDGGEPFPMTGFVIALSGERAEEMEP
jgi:hypothetical protein